MVEKGGEFWYSGIREATGADAASGRGREDDGGVMETGQSSLNKNIIFERVYREGNRPIQIWPQYARCIRSYMSHWHEDLELNVIYRGSAEYCIGGRRRKVSEGDFCLINSREVHSVEPCVTDQMPLTDQNQLLGITIMISHEFIKSLMPEYDKIFFRVDREEDRSETREKLYQIREIFLSGGQDMSQEFRKFGLVCEILSVLFERCVHPLADIDINEQKNDERIRIILDYIHNHYDEPLQQQKLADKFYFSRGYFAAFFKKYTGKTFKQYLVERRLAEAEKQLKGTKKSVSQIAHDTGFSDERRFIENFKQRFGMTPGVYRKQKTQ